LLWRMVRLDDSAPMLGRRVPILATLGALVAIPGIVKVVRNRRRIRWATFNGGVGPHLVDLAEAGPDRAHFAEFVEAVRREIEASRRRVIAGTDPAATRFDPGLHRDPSSSSSSSSFRTQQG
jgi:hypothetical protein